MFAMPVSEVQGAMLVNGAGRNNAAVTVDMLFSFFYLAHDIL
ncbi:hypothetical protein [Undibacterium sp. KW1]|nr:hypothetical protein [Undibacterium sp. KW1]